MDGCLVMMEENLWKFKRIEEEEKKNRCLLCKSHKPVGRFNAKAAQSLFFFFFSHQEFCTAIKDVAQSI